GKTKRGDAVAGSISGRDAAGDSCAGPIAAIVTGANHVGDVGERRKCGGFRRRSRLDDQVIVAQVESPEIDPRTERSTVIGNVDTIYHAGRRLELCAVFWHWNDNGRRRDGGNDRCCKS